MSSRKIMRKVWVDELLYDAAAEYAYIHRLTLSALGREVVSAICEEDNLETWRSAEDMLGRKSLNILVDAEDWEEARARSYKAGVSLHAMIRRRLIHATQSAGLL